MATKLVLRLTNLEKALGAIAQELRVVAGGKLVACADDIERVRVQIFALKTIEEKR